MSHVRPEAVPLPWRQNVDDLTDQKWKNNPAASLHPVAKSFSTNITQTAALQAPWSSSRDQQKYFCQYISAAQMPTAAGCSFGPDIYFGV